MKKKQSVGEETTAGQSMTFEQALERLEHIVQRLEAGEESLEDSLRLYEEAVTLWRLCEKRLHAAQERIKVLTDQEDDEAATESA